MATPTLDVFPIPAGGSVLLFPTSSASSITITRQNVTTGNIDTVYEGAYNEELRVIDMGDEQNVIAPLSQDSTYIYTITDANGTYSAPAISPITSITVQEDEFSRIFLNLFGASLRTLVQPKGYKKPTILYDMPVTGLPPLPAIHLIQDYVQSQEIPIGQNAYNPDINNQLTLPTIVDRHFLVTILTTSAEEREYYRNAVISIFLSLMNNPIQQIGNNVRHSFDSSSTQIMRDGQRPGFFHADVGLSFSGIFNATIITNFSLIESYNLNTSFQQE